MPKKLIPTEAQEQTMLIEWAEMMQGRYPELALLFHIPNEGRRSYQYGRELKRQGLKKGVPDLCLPVARGMYHGLFIEMKSQVGRPSGEQLVWIDALRNEGYAATVCHGWREAAQFIEDYLKRNH